VFDTNGIFERLRERIARRGTPSWYRPYLKLEGEAVAILDYSAGFVMGLLQTPEYAAAVFRTAHPEYSPETVEKKVAERLRRREVLTREKKPASFWLVLHEASLRTQVGDARIMRDQLAHILKEVENRHVTVQVLPFDTTPPVEGSFTLLTLADQSTLFYSEAVLSGQMTDNEATVARAREIYDRLRAEALPTAQSLALVRSYLEGYTV
jgi:hypothetical protein